jgi:hypothetical protein
MNVVFFSPFAGVWKHSEIELQIVNVLRRDNHKVDFIRCDEVLNNFCVTMSAHGLSFGSLVDHKKAVCKKCLMAKEVIQSFADVNSVSIRDYTAIASLSKVQNLLDNLLISDAINVEYRGVPIGRYCTYEFFLRHKLADLEIPEHLWVEFKQVLFNGLITAEFAYSYFSKNKVDHIFVYNELYSVNMIFTQIARQLGILTSSIEALGPIRRIHSRFVIDNELTNVMSLSGDAAWKKACDRSLSPLAVLKVLKNSLNLMSAKSFWTYSAALPKGTQSKLVRDLLDIPESKKVILLTLSSQDELLTYTFVKRGHEASLNSIDQLEIVSNLIEFARKNPEYVLIVRPHPREYPNKRENQQSDFAKQLYEVLNATVMPGNVRINFPEQRISIYQLASVTDLLINSTSSVGLEFALLGIPIASFKHDFPNVYPKSLNNYFSNSIPTSFEIDSFMENKLETKRTAFRWMYFKLYAATYNSFSTNTVVSRTVLRFQRRFDLGINSTKILGFVYRMVRFLEQSIFTHYKSKKLMKRIRLEIEPETLPLSYIDTDLYQKRLWSLYFLFMETLSINVVSWLIDRKIGRVRT